MRTQAFEDRERLHAEDDGQEHGEDRDGGLHDRVVGGGHVQERLDRAQHVHGREEALQFTEASGETAAARGRDDSPTVDHSVLALTSTWTRFQGVQDDLQVLGGPTAFDRTPSSLDGPHPNTALPYALTIMRNCGT